MLKIENYYDTFKTLKNGDIFKIPEDDKNRIFMKTTVGSIDLTTGGCLDKTPNFEEMNVEKLDGVLVVNHTTN